MEFLFELIMEFILEGTCELIHAKKASLWIRIPAFIILLAIYAAIFYLFVTIAINLWNTQLPISLIMLLLTCLLTFYLFFLISGFIKKTHS